MRRELLLTRESAMRPMKKQFPSSSALGHTRFTPWVTICNLFACSVPQTATPHKLYVFFLFGPKWCYSLLVQGELEHRHVKCFYAQTNKTFQYIHQVTGHECRICIINTIQQCLHVQKEEQLKSSDP